ncbi:MAG: hypothetical protein KDK23_02545 [Leptospiraceae bacterium]|nr:hypothetical protein [Leptospiraceae bacterium]
MIRSFYQSTTSPGSGACLSATRARTPAAKVTSRGQQPADVKIAQRALVFAKAVGILLLFLQLGQCASLQNYGKNRGKDFVDIFTAGAERRVYGGTAMVGPVFLGLAHQSRGFGYGLRAGSSGLYATGEPYSEISRLSGDSFLFLNSTFHHSLDGKQESKTFAPEIR